MPEFDRFACLTIQGGGVYGVSLLGQLKAFENAGFSAVALAGTSAGAIVATLYWSGLSPETIRDHLIARANGQGGMLSLVGPFDGATPQDIKRLTNTTKRIWSLLTWLQETSHSFVTKCAARIAFLALIPTAYRQFKFAAKLVQKRGIYSGDALRDFLDDLLRTSPGVVANEPLVTPRYVDGERRWLTFRDFRNIAENGNDPEGGRVYYPPLFLTATDVTTQRLEIINSVEGKYQDWVVADAVRASAGFPVFFRPLDQDCEQEEASYVDGGVITNFPSFIFSNEFAFRTWLINQVPHFDLIATRAWVNIGLRLTSGKRNRGYAGETRTAQKFVYGLWSMLFGGARNELEDRLLDFVPRAVLVQLPYEDTGGPSSVMDVDTLRAHTVTAMFNNGLAMATDVFAELKFDLPDQGEVAPVLQKLVGHVQHLFAGLDIKCRANVFVPQEEELALAYSINMEDIPGAPVQERNSDREMRLEFRQGLTGFCFVRRRPLVCNLTRFAAAIDEASKGMSHPPDYGFNEETQGKVRKDRTLLISLPIFDPEVGSVHVQLPRANFQDEQGIVAEIDSPFDGPVLGVLNLDAALNYGAAGVSENPVELASEPRILGCILAMQNSSIQLARTLSKHFAYRVR